MAVNFSYDSNSDAAKQIRENQPKKATEAKPILQPMVDLGKNKNGQQKLPNN